MWLWIYYTFLITGKIITEFNYSIVYVQNFEAFWKSKATRTMEHLLLYGYVVFTGSLRQTARPPLFKDCCGNFKSGRRKEQVPWWLRR